MSVAPAFEIPLTDSERIALGELCVIQGQIEHLLNMIIVTIASRKVPVGTPFTISSAWERKMHAMLGVSVKEWIIQVRQEVVDDTILDTCEGIFRDIERLCEDRNDFVHATYGAWLDIPSQPNTVIPLTTEDIQANSISKLARKGAAAKRSRTNLARSVSELLTVRDKAAEISRRLHAVMGLLLHG
jgi:hypothetical protein